MQKSLETAIITNPEPNNSMALPRSKSNNLGINYPKQSETFLMIFVFGIEKHAKLTGQAENNNYSFVKQK